MTRHAGEVLVGCFDGMIWAREFVAAAKANPSIATDEATMVGWFANAIMAGYDEANRQRRHSQPDEGNDE